MKAIKTFVAVTALSLMSVGAFAQNSSVTSSTQDKTQSQKADKDTEHCIDYTTINDRSLMAP